MSILIVAIFAIVQITALWFVWSAISSARTSQGAVSWVVFLLTAPYIAVPLYLFLGHHKFKDYVIGRRGSAQMTDDITEFGKAHLPDTPPEFPPNALEAIAELPIVRGNGMRLLVDGDETFESVFAALDAAHHYILVQFYIVHDDVLGRALQDRLIAAAKRGVTVHFICDRVGSHKLPQSYRDTLSAAGVHVVEPGHMIGPKNRFQLNFRNHRKTVIVDGTVGFTGGLNVGDEYMGRDPKFGHWRDTFVEIRGPMVTQLQLVFVEDWHWMTDCLLTTGLNWKPVHDDMDMTGLVSSTGPGDTMETGALFFFTAIANAKKRIWIASPYFVPDTDVLSALKIAALQGVDVRILVPDMIDHKAPWMAAFAYFDEVRNAGVQIWRYKAGFMHQKVLVVDDTMAAIGTANLDNRSFRLNFETMAVFFDSRAAHQVEQMLTRDFEQAFKLEQVLNDQPFHIRVGARISRLLAPIL